MLYLHHKGIVKIANLEPYRCLRCLHLESNAIRSLDGLRALTVLASLYVDGNALCDLRGIEDLVQLRHLSANDNVLETIEHVAGLPLLQAVCFRRNRIRALDPLRSCPKLASVDVAHNDLRSRDALDAVTSLPNLEVLYFADGNPVAREIDGYRRVVVARARAIQWLDDARVDDDAHRLAHAYVFRGGVQGELQESLLIANERLIRERETHEAFPSACAFALRRFAVAVDDDAAPTADGAPSVDSVPFSARSHADANQSLPSPIA